MNLTDTKFLQRQSSAEEIIISLPSDEARVPKMVIKTTLDITNHLTQS